MRSQTRMWTDTGVTEREDVESAVRAATNFIHVETGDQEAVARLAFSATEGPSRARVYYFDSIGDTPSEQRRVIVTLSDADIWEARFAD